MALRRRTKWARLVPALALSPVFAGALGGLVMMTALITGSIIGGVPIASDETAAGIVFALLVAVFVSVLGGIAYTVIVGTPFIAAAWLGAHVFTPRRRIDMALATAAAGALYAHFIFSQGLGFPNAGQGGSVEDWREAMGLLPAAAGLITGAVTGVVLASVGYAAPELTAEDAAA